MKNKVKFLFVIVVATTSLGAVYKWVDDQGQVHYTDEPPPDSKSKELTIEPGPPPGEVKKAQQRLDKLKKQWQRSTEDKITGQGIIKKLGPLPDNKSSKYLVTKGTGVLYKFDEMAGSLSITVLITKIIPHSAAYLEAHFQNPSDLNDPIVIGKIWRAPQPEVIFSTPYLKGIECKNYEVLINVCDERGCEDGKHDTEKNLFDIHHQIIQSRMDLTSIKSEKDFEDALEALNGKGGYCP